MSEPKKYRKKPVTIEAMQWDGTAEGATPIIDWILSNGGAARFVGQGESHSMRHDEECRKVIDPRDGLEYPTGQALPTAPAFLVIYTLEGSHRQDARDFTLQGVFREFYPCRDDIFKKTYEEVTDG